jgi:hypothetical protein
MSCANTLNSIQAMFSVRYEHFNIKVRVPIFNVCMEMIVSSTKAFDLYHSSFDPVTCTMSMDSAVIDISISLSCASGIEEGEEKRKGLLTRIVIS